MKTAKDILNVLDRQDFADFYSEDGMFSVYIRADYPEGHPKHVTKEMVLKEIAHIFSVPNE